MKNFHHASDSCLRSLIDGTTTPSRLTPAVAVALSSLGCLELDRGRLAVTSKASRVLARMDRKRDQLRCDGTVADVLDNELLIVPHASVQHRQVWEAVGEDKFTRQQVLRSLQSLRRAAWLKSWKYSNNNFQVFWARKKDLAGPTKFEVNGQ
jgi:hypothetical protein